MITIERRSLFAAGAAAALGLAGLVRFNPASASAPQIGTQAPSYDRLKIGAFEMTVVSDGTLSFNPSLWAAPQAEVVAALVADARSPTSIPFQLNTMVVNTGNKLVLVDTGDGGRLQKGSGRLLANLASAGYRPEQVDVVVFTHLHPDHLWGAVDKVTGSLSFPNAEYVVSETELQFWTDKARLTEAPAEMRQMIDATQSALRTLASRTRPIRAGSEIVPGIMSIDTPGHTPGHISLQVTSNGDALLIAGDVVANATLSFRNPGWGIGFDVDKEQAASTRVAFLDRCVADKILVASYHLPFPAIGHVVRDGMAFRWLPADWRVTT